MKIAMIVLARGGSKRIPGKIYKKFCGKPLIEWTLDFMKDFKYEKYIYTDCQKVRDICKKYDVKVRDKKYENKDGRHQTQKELLEYNKEIKADIIILLQATSPLREKKLLKKAIQEYKKNEYDIALACNKIEKIIYDKDNMRINKTRTYSSKEHFYIETGSFYIFKKQQILKKHITNGKRIFCISKYDIDLDTLDDWKKAEILYQNNYYN
jgi:CMP-N-acetylneuraminic acid synthetase